MRITAVLICTLCLAGSVLACQVPVFRFALERWPADKFRLLVTSRGPLEEKLQSELDYLAKALEDGTRAVNLQLEVVDLTDLTETKRLSISGLEHAGEGPTMILMPPASWKTDDPGWIGAANAENLAKLLVSPARQKCGEHLLKGESAVWFLIESGDPEKDARARKILAEGLAKAEAELELPVGVIRREDLNKGFDVSDPDNILRSDVPLKISFATETISRSNPAESIFLPTMVEPQALASGEPLIVPVYGRGITFGPLPASETTVDRIVGACEFLCGACSCQVKEGNPGYDLLFDTNWDEHLNAEVITVESDIIQNALDVVTFNPAAQPVAATQAETKKGSPAVIGIGIAAIVLAIGGLIAGFRMSGR